MNDAVNRRLDCFERIDQFMTKYAARFTGVPLAATLNSELEGIITALGGNAAGQEGAGRIRTSGTELKATLRDRIRAEIRHARTSAEGVAAQKNEPELVAQFNQPDSNNDDVLVAAAKAVAKTVGVRAADFDALGFGSAAFISGLSDLLGKFGEAGKTQTGGKGEIALNVAQGEAKVERGLEIRTQLHAVVINMMRNSPGERAEWEVARHIERPSSGGDDKPAGNGGTTPTPTPTPNP